MPFQKRPEKSFVLTTSDLERRLGSRVAVIRAANEGKLVQIGSGYYASPNIDPRIAPVLVAGKFFPKSVVSGISALVLHELTDEVPNQVHVDIDYRSSIRNRVIKARRVVPKFLIGIETRRLHGIPVRLYDRERSLCDAYRIDKDGPIFLKALKRYVKAGNARPNKIAEYDRILGTKVLSRLSQEFADG